MQSTGKAAFTMQGVVVKALTADQANALKASQQQKTSLTNNHVHVCVQRLVAGHRTFPLLPCSFCVKVRQMLCHTMSQGLRFEGLATQCHSSNMVASVDGERKHLMFD